MTTISRNTQTTGSPTQAQWDAANKFLDELFVNSTLSQGYLDICQQANGQDNAPKMLNNWLQQQGYDTTPELVYAALIALQNTSLGYWLGVYGQSFFQDSQGHTSAAPVLAIISDAEGNAIPYLDGVALQNYTFKSVITNNIPNPTLTWGLDSNSTAGNIIFYYTPPVNANPEPPTGYTGNWFKGSLQTASSTSSQSYFGGLTDPNNLQQNTVSLGDATKQSIDFIAEYKYWFIGGGVTLAVLGILVFRYKLGRWPFQRVQEQIQDQQEVVEQNEPQLINQEDPEQRNIRYQDNNGNLVNHPQELQPNIFPPEQPVDPQPNVLSPEVLKQRKKEYEKNITRLANKAKKINPNMNQAQAEQWLLGQSLIFDPEVQVPQQLQPNVKQSSEVLPDQSQKIQQPEPSKVSPKDLSQHQSQQQPLQQQKVQSTQNNALQVTDKERTAVRSQQVPSTDNKNLDKSEVPEEKSQFKGEEGK